MTDDARRPRVLVCSLGGTIAMTDRGDGGVVPTESAQSLVDAVPGLDTVADIEAMSFRQIPGAHLTLDDIVELGRVLGGRSKDVDGIVITQGTDTLEETSFALDLLWDADTPLVVTGAMRNPTLPGTDGPANLLAAVTVAGAGSARGAGCLVVLGDEVHAARFVQKRHTTRPSAFESPGAGAVGVVSEGDVHIWAAPQRVRLPAPAASPVPAVALVRMSLGDDGRLLDEIGRLGYAGLVVEAFGGGHVPPAVARRLGDLATSLPVVLASRTGAGPVLHATYGFPGSELDLLGRGLLPAGTLDGLRARIVLSFGLAAGVSGAELGTLFGGN